MGLQTLAGTNIQYFSMSEEIIALTTMFAQFIINISPGWILFVTAISLGFIAYAIMMRLKHAGGLFS